MQARSRDTRWSIAAGVSVCLMLALFLAPAALAQSRFATLTGTVTDSSGAVVADVAITVTNMASGDARKVTTTKEGFFSVTPLPAGSYRITAETAGFAKYEARDITLNSSDSRNINISLQLATTTQTVEVSAQAQPLVTVDSGEKSATISTKDLQDLSLVSRNAAEFIKILPGAVIPANGGVNRLAYTGEVIGINGSGIGGSQGGLSAAIINGQMPDITQDGAHTFDPGASGNATPVNPNPNMIEEVKVLTSNFAAENNKGPVIMNVVSKGGGHDFHGEGYFFARNAALNANDWFNNYSKAGKPDSAYYYPGGNIGGPVLIPGTGFNRNRDKLFFFDGFEYYKQKIDGGVNRAFVMNDAMFNGDFSGVDKTGVRQPTLGVVPTQPAAGSILGWNPSCTVTNGVLSPACIDQGALTMLRAYQPAPNVDPTQNDGFNYVQALSVPQNSYQNLMRMDWNITQNTKAYVRYNRQRETQNMPNGLWIGRGSDNSVPSPSNIIGANGSDAVAASLLHIFSPTMTNEATFAYTYIDFPNMPEDPAKLLRKDMGFPYKGIYGNEAAPALVTWQGTFPNLGAVGNDYHPTMICYKGIPSVSDNLTKVFGTHTTKYGFYYEHMYNTQDNWGQYNGSINYGSWASASGNNYADALMGIGMTGYTEERLPPPGTVGANIAAFYAQDSWKATRRLTLEYGMRFEHVGKAYDPNGIGMAIFDPSKYSDDPAQLDNNTGLLWHKIANSVPLSGTDSRFLFFSPRFGLAYDVFGTGKTIIRGGWGKYRAYDSVQSRNYTDPQITALGSASWSCGWNDARCPTWASIDNNAMPSPPVGTGPGGGLKGIKAANPKVDEQPLVTSYSFSIDQRLPAKFFAEISYVGNHSDYGIGQLDMNAVPLGTMLGLDGGTNVDPYRPRHNYQAIALTEMIGKTSQYDSLQMSLHRSAGMLSLQANYTFSKALGIVDQTQMTSALPDWGTKWLWGTLPNNRAHTLSLAYVVSLPELHSNALTNSLLGGWQFSGITQFTSGANLTAQNWQLSLSRSDGQNNVTLLGTNGINQAPVLTCDPRKDLAPHQYLNGSCFALPGEGQLGNAGMPYLPGPMFWNSDLTLSKNFKITERQKVQLRFQMFNFLNHPLESFTNSDANLKLDNWTADGTLNKPDFGYARYKFGHRVIEFGLKYQF